MMYHLLINQTMSEKILLNKLFEFIYLFIYLFIYAGVKLKKQTRHRSRPLNLSNKK